MVIFSENMNALTITPFDFVVEGVAPLAAVMGTSQTRVYLTLASDLAADAEPLVAIAAGGSVSDLAGNSLIASAGATTDALDEIAPTYTVTLDKTVTNNEVVISVSSNETGSVPQVKVHNIDGLSVKTLSILVTSSTSWEATFTTSAAHEGENSVVVIGFDKNINLGTQGDATITAGEFSGSALTFVQDTIAPVYLFDPADGASVDGATPFFVTVTWDDQVTLDAATLDAADVSGQVGTLDNKTFLLTIDGGLSIGDHTYIVSATDLAGNSTLDVEATFTVISEAPGGQPLTTVADTGSAGFSGDGGQATSADLNQPQGMALDTSGNIYIADSGNHRVRKVEISTGIITTIAGTGSAGFSGDGGPATSASLDLPRAIAVDGGSNVFIADFNNNRVRKVNVSTGTISTVVIVPAPIGLEVDTDGDLHIVDPFGHKVRTLEGAAVPIPTPTPSVPGLVSWTMLVLAALFATVVFLRLRYRQRVVPN